MIAAAKGIDETAERLAATGLTSKRSEIAVMTMGADFSLHELEMWLLAKRQRSISIVAVTDKLRSIRESVHALAPTEGK